MEVVESLNERAGRLYVDSHFRESYHTFLKTANAALVRLASDVVWSGDDVMIKPDVTGELFRIAVKAMERARDIVTGQYVISLNEKRSDKASFIAGEMNLGSSTEQQEQLRAKPSYTSSTIKISADALPSIPPSPLPLLHAHHAARLQQAEESYQTAQTASINDLSLLRRLVEDVRIERTKVTELNELFKSVSRASATQFDPLMIAGQITVVDAQLFGGVNVRDQMGDGYQTLKSKLCADWGDYLERVCIGSVLSARSSAPDSDKDALMEARAQTLSTWIAAAHHLFYTYRNIASLTTLLRALASPPLIRLKKTWASLAPTSLQMYTNLTTSFGKGSTSDHFELLTQILEYHYRGGSVMAAIPCLPPFLTEITRVYELYGLDASLPGSQKLTPTGQIAREELLTILEMCQGKGRPNPSISKTIERIMSSHATHDPSPPSPTKSKSQPQQAPEDLSVLTHNPPTPARAALLPGGRLPNLGVAHWLLTRIYLTPDELWTNSVAAEPLVKGEAVPQEIIQARKQKTGPHFAVGKAPAAPPTTTKRDPPPSYMDQFLGDTSEPPPSILPPSSSDYMDQYLGDTSEPPPSLLPSSSSPTSPRPDHHHVGAHPSPFSVPSSNPDPIGTERPHSHPPSTELHQQQHEQGAANIPLSLPDANTSVTFEEEEDLSPGDYFPGSSPPITHDTTSPRDNDHHPSAPIPTRSISTVVGSLVHDLSATTVPSDSELVDMPTSSSPSGEQQLVSSPAKEGPDSDGDDAAFYSPESEDGKPT